jgi:hypothetical protein
MRITGRLLVAAVVLLLAFSHNSHAATTRPIQAQGSSPYCLFAVNAYLINQDMWQLAAEYHRRNLPTWPGTVVPQNSHMFALTSELYGTRWRTYRHYDFAAAKAGVRAGRPTAFSGNGHAIVVTGFNHGTVTYLDSLHAGAPQQQSETQLRAWWDGWAWYAE